MGNEKIQPRPNADEKKPRLAGRGGKVREQRKLQVMGVKKPALGGLEMRDRTIAYKPNFFRREGSTWARRMALTTHMMMLFLASETSALVA